MSSLSSEWSDSWRSQWQKYHDDLRVLAEEIVRLPRWRWLKRSTLKHEYRELQRLIGYTIDYADQEARDRLLLQSIRQTP